MNNSSAKRLYGRKRDTSFSKWSLYFRDPLVERQFQKTHAFQSQKINGGYLLVGILTYLVYSILDLLVLHEEVQMALIIRAGISVLLIIIAAASRWFQNHWGTQLILSSCIAISGAGIILMTSVLSAPFSYLYYAGLILVIIYAATLSMLRFVNMATVSTGLLIAYLLTMFYINPVPKPVAISNSFFLVITVMIACWASYWQEIYIRRTFVQRYLLRQEAKRAVKLSRVADAGNKAKSEFLAIVSHELRTPLNAIIGFSEILEQKMFGPLGDEKYDEYAADIADSGRHLLGIINGILDLSRAEAGTLEMREDDSDLTELVDRALKLSRDDAARKGVRLGLVPSQEDIVVWVDEGLIRQVLVNLISNAVKFTDRGGLVDVALERTLKGEVRLTVRDTGVGIAEHKLEAVTEPFVQVESALARENGGVGLGLPLVKKIVEMHGGKFLLDSQPGIGTTATVILPPSRWVEGGQADNVIALKK